MGIESGLRLVSGFRIIRMGPAVRHWQATKEALVVLQEQSFGNRFFLAPPVFGVWGLAYGKHYPNSGQKLGANRCCCSFSDFVCLSPLTSSDQELRELWIVIGAVAETVKTLFWVGVMLIFVIWIFGILVSMCLAQDVRQIRSTLALLGFSFPRHAICASPIIHNHM